MSTKAEPVHRGTLVCVVLKAKNLPNKKSIGKQDPYCTLQLGTLTQKTKPDKRGGQHPQWDEQLHFEIYDDMEDQLRSNSVEAGDSLGTSTQKKSKKKSPKRLRVACYADDTKEPEFIGDGMVDLTETLKSGEFDEWVTIKAKDRYAGEVYLELTFYSAAAPPKMKKPSQPVVPTGTTYGGAGTFSEDFDDYEFAPKLAQKEPSHAPIPSYMRPEGQQSSRLGHPLRPNNSSGMTTSKSHAQLGALLTEDIPHSLRPSSSMAQLDTYTPPYAPPTIHREKSPAPSGYPDPNFALSPLAPSPSTQLYGHRLSDAAPASMIAPQQLQDISRYNHALPVSASQQQMPQMSNYRVNQPDKPDAAVDDLTRPLSALSMNQRAQHQPHDSYQPQYVSHPAQHAFSTSPVPLPASASIDQFGRPIPLLHAQSYGTLPIGNVQSGNSLFPAPTPPPPSNSAPPAVYPIQGQQQQQQQQQWALPPGQHQHQHQASLPLNVSQLVAPPSVVSPTGRPSSAAGLGMPNRPLSSSGFHALPPVPGHAPPQQQQHEQGMYQQNFPNTVEQHGGVQQGSYASPALSSRPLPSTSNIIAPPPSSSFAPPPPSSNYYPPPSQTPSHYVPPPPPTMPWASSAAPPPPSNAYSSYPPPPPGPGNGGYHHAAPQQTSPSTHPGQYPPPPPIHHVDYSYQHQPVLQQQQYFNQAPPTQALPPPHLSHSPAPPAPPAPPQSLPPSQSYYRPQAQHPY